MGSTLKGTISIMMNKLVFLILKMKSENFLIKVVSLPFFFKAITLADFHESGKYILFRILLNKMFLIMFSDICFKATFGTLSIPKDFCYLMF